MLRAGRATAFGSGAAIHAAHASSCLMLSGPVVWIAWWRDHAEVPRFRGAVGYIEAFHGQPAAQQLPHRRRATGHVAAETTIVERGQFLGGQHDLQPLTPGILRHEYTRVLGRLPIIMRWRHLLIINRPGE